MTLGEKMLKARLEAGLSQRQLCDGLITRNMLSQIEHGTARPSMDTLRQLAARLEKPVSWFLDETVLASSNQNLLLMARKACDRENYEKVIELLSQWQQPDELFDPERQYLLTAATLKLADRMLQDGKTGYARQLLEELEPVDGMYPVLHRQQLLLMGKLPGADLTQIVKALPSLDEELLLRARAALVQKQTEKAAALLDAAEDREDHSWNLLRGRVFLLEGRYERALSCLQIAEKAFPEETWPLLETCFRELGDYRRAYDYACKQK